MPYKSGKPFRGSPWPEFILVITASLLFLANLEFLGSEFGEIVQVYWPTGLLLYAVCHLASKNG